jgi:hypothetical protein
MAVARGSGMGALVMASSAVPILVGATVVELASSLAPLGLAVGRMGFEAIGISVLLVEAVKPLIAVVSFAVLGAQVAHVTVPSCSGVGSVLSASASSLQIEARRRQGSNFANSGFYQKIVTFVFFVYRIGKRYSC